MATLTTANEEAANKKLVPAIDVFSSTDDESLLDFKLLQEGKHYHQIHACKTKQVYTRQSEDTPDEDEEANTHAIVIM